MYDCIISWEEGELEMANMVIVLFFTVWDDDCPQPIAVVDDMKAIQDVAYDFYLVRNGVIKLHKDGWQNNGEYEDNDCSFSGKTVPYIK